MDPIALALLASALSPALLIVIEKIGEKLVEVGIEPTIEMARAKLLKGYEQEKAEQELRAVVMAALDDTRHKLPDAFDRSKITNKLTGRTAETYALLAAAAVELADPDPAKIPARLLADLELEESHRDLLACFLGNFRPRLADTKTFTRLIEYSNDLDRRGLLAGLAVDVAGIARGVSEMAQNLERLVAYFRIAADEDEALRQYLETLQDRLRWLPLPLAAPSAASGQTDAELRCVYVPLSLRDLEAEAEARRRAERFDRSAAEMENELREIEARPVGLGEVIARHERFAIIGKAGCGKTTLLKMAALAFAEDRAKEDLDWQGEPLFPIFVRLRNFGAFLSDHPEYREPGPGALTAYLTHHFSISYDLDLTTRFFAQRLNAGGCLILLDGLDEVSQGRPDVAQQVDAFIRFYVSKGKGNRFGLASRPRGFEMVQVYLRASRFAVCDVNPLTPQGIRRLTARLLDWIVNDPRQLAEDRQNLPDKILASDSLTELAATPLFCTALTLVYKWMGSDLPQRRVDVLEQVVDLLLVFWKAQDPDLEKKHDLAVLDGTDVSLDDLEIVAANKRSRLSYLAYRMQTADIKTEVDADIACAWLQSYLEDEEGCDPDVANRWAAGFLRYAHEYSGLFVEDKGPGVYAFTHEGFREYLAARELVDRGDAVFTDEVLEHLLEDAWESVILLAAAFRGYSRKARRDLITCAL